MSSWGLGSGRREAPGRAKLPHIHSKHIYIQGERMVEPSPASYLCAGPRRLTLPETQTAKLWPGRVGPVESELSGQTAGGSGCCQVLWVYVSKYLYIWATYCITLCQSGRSVYSISLSSRLGLMPTLPAASNANKRFLFFS